MVCISAHLLHGYEGLPKNHLIPGRNSAIVRRIFYMALAGKTSARLPSLNREHPKRRLHIFIYLSE